MGRGSCYGTEGSGDRRNIATTVSLRDLIKDI
jgi:hypothetical protein